MSFSRKYILSIGVVLLFAAMAGTFLYVQHRVFSEQGSPTGTESSGSHSKASPEQSPGGAGGMESSTYFASTFEIELPAGWSKLEEESVQNNAPGDYNLISFGDEAGNYFAVFYDSGRFGDSPTGDSLWSIESDGALKVIIANEQPLCRNQGELKLEDQAHSYYCGYGDGELAIAGERVGGLEIAGHSYFFRFGNTERESGVDLDLFRRIFQSFRGKR